MKSAWITSLVALVASAACIDRKSSDVNQIDAIVNVKWSVRHVDGTEIVCPSGVTEAQITAQPVDPNTLTAEGAPVITLFDCDAKAGTISLVPGPFTITLRLISSDGTTVYASSLETPVITLTIEDTSQNFDIYDDGGYLELAWNILNKQDDALDCETADVSDVRVVLTPTAGSGSGVAGAGSAVTSNALPCSTYTAITDVIPEGTYSVAVNAESNGEIVGTFPVATVPINGPNKVSGVGTINIPLTTM
jgi:hypothetical protein